jgi:hypothetical protein
VEVPEQINGFSVTRIGAGAFQGHNGITEVILPNSITHIGPSAFINSSLTAINIPYGVTTIGSRAFQNCSMLEEIYLPASLIEIGEHAFSFTGLVKVTINGNPNFRWGIFVGSRELSTVTISDTVTSLGSGMFANITSLEQIILPPSITELPSGVFQGTNLKELKIPQNVTAIHSSAFSDNHNLETLIIPESVTFIAQDAFSNTGALILGVFENSYAHTFAQQHGLNFILVSDATIPDIRTAMPLSGTVTYVTGQPSADATVELLNFNGTLHSTTTTDASGAYTFNDIPLGRYILHATSTNNRIGTEQISIRRMTVFDVMLVGNPNITAKSPSSVSGTVTFMGSGVEGATVTLLDENANTIESVATNTQGEYAMHNIPNGTYTLRVDSNYGSAAEEITLFNDNAVRNFAIIATSASITGQITRDGDPVAGADVVLYNLQGFAVKGVRTDTNGQYTFSNVTHGNYAVSASVDGLENETIVKLTGNAFVNITENKAYTVNITVARQTAGTVRIEGQVVQQGGSQRDTRVVLRDVFGNERGSFITGANGKYVFNNVSEGVYFVIATTQLHGAGFTMVTVRNGVVTGEKDIWVSKSSTVEDLEQIIFLIPEGNANAIADAKALYDGLSPHEKNELHYDAVDKLDELIRDIMNIDTDIEKIGLVVSADEIRDMQNISFELTVAQTVETDISAGVETEAQFIQQLINQASEEKNIFAYYTISMVKTIGGNEKQINTISKDTDTTGEITVTLPIPEAYRGRANYHIAHAHNGEVFTIAGLVNEDGDTVTFNVNRFSTFVLIYDDIDSSFGDVPPTGVPDITGAFTAMLALFAISAALWGVALRRQD